MKELLRYFGIILRNCAAESNARYKNYLKRSNEQARAEAQTLQAQQEVAFAQRYFDAYYYTILEIVFTALQNVMENIHLYPVQRSEQLRAPSPVRISNKGFYYCVFQGYYKAGYGMTADAFRRILQAECDSLCEIYGFARLRIFIELCADQRIIFRVALWDDVQRSVTI